MAILLDLKLPLVLEHDTACPVAILIHNGTPNDTNIFPEVLKELRKRRIIREGDLILADKGYYKVLITIE